MASRTQAPWMDPGYFSFADFAKIVPGELKAEVCRNWAHRGYSIIPGIGFVHNEAGNPSRMPLLNVYQALFFSRVTRQGLSLRDAQTAFFFRLQNEAWAHHIRRQIEDRVWHAREAAEAEAAGDRQGADWAKALADRPIESAGAPFDQRYGEQTPLYSVIMQYCFDRMFAEVEDPATEWFWVIPRDSTGVVRPMETQAVPAEKLDVWVQDILDQGGQAEPIQIDFTDIVRTVNAGVERLKAGAK